MALDYNRVKNKIAAPKIRQYGKALVLTRPGSSEGWTKSLNDEGRFQWENDTTHEIVFLDPATTPATYNGFGLETSYEAKEIDGTNIKAGDTKMLIVDLPDLVMGDKITLTNESKTLTISLLKPLKPGIIKIYDEVYLR